MARRPSPASAASAARWRNATALAAIASGSPGISARGSSVCPSSAIDRSGRRIGGEPRGRTVIAGLVCLGDPEQAVTDRLGVLDQDVQAVVPAVAVFGERTIQIAVAVLARVTGQLAQLELTLVANAGRDALGRLCDLGDVHMKSRPVHDLKVTPACMSTAVRRVSTLRAADRSAERSRQEGHEMSGAVVSSQAIGWGPAGSGLYSPVARSSVCRCTVVTL